MSSEIVKYNYDVVVATQNELAKFGESVKANESIIIEMSDEMKTDVEQMKNRDDIIRGIIINPDIGYCLGFNFIGRVEKRGGIFWKTQVFYFNERKAYFDKLFKR